MKSSQATYDILLGDFNRLIGMKFSPSSEYYKQALALIEFCQSDITSQLTRKNNIVNAINQKFELNKFGIKTLIDFAANNKLYFNFHEKKEIKTFFDDTNFERYAAWIKPRVPDRDYQLYLELFKPISSDQSLTEFRTIIDTSDSKNDILHALFAAYIFHSFDRSKVHEYFSNVKKSPSDYYEYLHSHFSDNLKRELALSFLVIDDQLLETCGDLGTLKDSVTHFIKDTYDKLSNHCFLSILIDTPNNKSLKWELFSDIILYAEKFIEEKLKIGYFHPQKIASDTKQHIKELDDADARFDIANGGFTYHDSFILTNEEFKEAKKDEAIDDYAILLLFEKNKRDETPIPCPACRSLNVRGNSYPVLGVKSWECNNILCPEKSKFNRGKRYSLSSLIKQEAIFYEENEIKNGTIKKWQLDLLTKPNTDDILDFLIKHYSLVRDTIEVTNYQTREKLYGRNVKSNDFSVVKDGTLERFYNSAYFRRFVLKNNVGDRLRLNNISPYVHHEIYNGDSNVIIRSLDKNSVDGAVTSPPYYNAKEYSQWDNIYCYLYDMYNNALAVYDVLKPGASYLYNIFDYFDNENNVVFSAMGKKRMILGAYIIYLFKKAGFELVKNIIWYKGHIQGNRSFNQGNTFPYYQAPLNCYEHIFHFIKPPRKDNVILPDIVYFKPVHKIVNGENVLGHTAPFPLNIPTLLTKRMLYGEKILDPYSGSFTTSRAAMLSKISSIGIEYDRSYCDLGIKLMKNESNKLNL